jgi:hypothetical protein
MQLGRWGMMVIFDLLARPIAVCHVFSYYDHPIGACFMNITSTFSQLISVLAKQWIDELVSSEPLILLVNYGLDQFLTSCCKCPLNDSLAKLAPSLLL